MAGNINRRNFLKALTGASAAPYITSGGILLNAAPGILHAAPVDYAAAAYQKPAGVMPQVINIFLYGGASELAGNLSNIRDIETNSQNSYRQEFRNNNFLDFDSEQNGQVTPNRFWSNAGGAEMEAMLAADQMSVYRTMTKVKSTTRSHRESLFLSHKGTLDIDGTPGIGTRLAALLFANKSEVDTVPLADGKLVSEFQAGAGVSGLEAMPLPFVSFEGETNTFSPDLDLNPSLPLGLRGLSLNESFDNQYNRNDIICCGINDNSSPEQIQAYENLRTNSSNVFSNLLGQAQTLPNYTSRFGLANDGFKTRQTMDALIGELEVARDVELPAGVEYPDNNFGNRVKAAVTLALHNPSSLYITVGDGLGGWDDHNNGVERYAGRMQNVMRTMQAAMAHISGFTDQTINGLNRTTTDNIVVNMFGDFGRLVNLNDSNGWDHANTQNLYTFGGSDVRSAGAAAMGKVVGLTRREGTTKTNNQFTSPTESSYQFEPMAVAASVYSYFGATNTLPLTESPESGFAGEQPIDETQAAVQQNDYTET